MKRSTSTRGSRLFEPAFDNLREGTTFRNRFAGEHGRSAAPTPTISLRSASVKHGRRKSGSRSANGGLAMGLLGPSSQLAGVVAGLTAASVEAAENTMDPSTAAAVASAVAVAGATGRVDGSQGGGAGGGTAARSWKHTNRTDSLFDSDPTDLTSLLYEGEGASSTLVAKHDPVVRYAAPVANIAGQFSSFTNY